MIIFTEHAPEAAVGYIIVINRELYNWRASEASETLSGVYKFELMRYIYIYIYMYGGTYAIIVAHDTHT